MLYSWGMGGSLGIERGEDMPDWVTLIGVLIIILGFAFKVDVLAVVLIAGLATGLAAGMSVTAILAVLGQAFVANRLMTIFLISFPVIAVIERYGLKEQSANLISKIKQASVGKVLALYTLIRWVAAAFSVRLGGHVQFVRPLILPMAQAAGVTKFDRPLSDAEDEEIKGLAAASENYGNFFGQNIFPAASGVILIQGALVTAGYQVSLADIATASIPIGVIMMVIVFIQFTLFDRKMKGKVTKA